MFFQYLESGGGIWTSLESLELLSEAFIHGVVPESKNPCVNARPLLIGPSAPREPRLTGGGALFSFVCTIKD
jgi:hypothetical protein